MTAITPDRVTVLVPTRNERVNIGRFLSSLHPDVALIVVDSSDDETPELIRRIRPRRTTIVEAAVGIAEARQIASELADTPWLLFTDADVAFDRGYFAHLATVVPGAEDGAILGAKLSADRHAGYYRWFDRGRRLLTFAGVPAASGSNMLLRAEALEAVGGFDTALTVNEDSEVVFRVRRHGWEVRFDPHLVVVAFDHRRLERGAVRKTVHSAARCALLFSGLMPAALRSRSWGYWSTT